ncbi:MAG: PIG-L family deacetylase, partial [Armatimonadota bacterium]|nr:PIG-L family deacetylase [Armatimonadota bacterium]
SVLAVGAHPDDVEILAAGTLARYAAAGAKVTICCATAGELGHAAADVATRAAARLAEARAAAAHIGARLICLELPDGGVADTPETRRRAADAVRAAEADLVITHAPHDYHPDHRATSAIVFAATFIASSPQLVTGSPPVRRAPPLFYMDTIAGIGFVPEEYVDITEVMDTKRAMLREHRSQLDWLRARAGVDVLELMEVTARFRGFACGARYAEGFRREGTWLRQGTGRLLP